MKIKALFFIIFIFQLGLAADQSLAEKYDLIVSADGTGAVKTISEAIARVPENNRKRFTILIKPGTYDEQIRIPANKPYISLIGEDAKTTKLQFKISNKMAGSTSAAFAFYVGGHSFTAENLTFENTFGPGSQAVAVVAEADRIVFKNSRFIGWQDTLYAKGGRQLYQDCYIEGHVDFIFGQASAVFDNCVIHSKGDGYLTAPMRFSDQEVSGYVFYKSKLTAENIQKGVYLGRPWRDYGRTVFLETEMGEHIRPEGWHHWEPQREKTAYFAEYKSSGKGGDVSKRVAWSKQLNGSDSEQFFPANFLKGKDGWNPYNHDNAWLEKTRPDWMLVTWGTALRQEPHWYETDEAVRIGNQLILYQKDNGGWEKNADFTRMVSQAEKEQITAKKSDFSETTIDNRTTYPQLQYLAKLITGNLQKSSPPSQHPQHLEAFFKGFDYLLSSQYPNGGFPQFFPLKKGYYTHITYNDDAMVGVLDFLKEIVMRKPDYKFVDEDRIKRATDSLTRGVDVILRTQVIVKGQKTVWCAQHDEVTLEPAPARTFEPISLSGSESVGLVRHLMAIENPSKVVIDAIESAIKWFEKSKINGIKVVEGANAKGENDRIVVEDKKAPPIWARFYDLKTNEPIFMGRDAIARKTLAEIERERRTGYAYYTNSPQRLVESDYPKWREKIKKLKVKN